MQQPTPRHPFFAAEINNFQFKAFQGLVGTISDGAALATTVHLEKPLRKLSSAKREAYPDEMAAVKINRPPARTQKAPKRVLVRKSRTLPVTPHSLGSLQTALASEQDRAEVQPASPKRKVRKVFYQALTIKSRVLLSPVLGMDRLPSSRPSSPEPLERRVLHEPDRLNVPAARQLSPSKGRAAESDTKPGLNTKETPQSGSQRAGASGSKSGKESVDKEKLKFLQALLEQRSEYVPDRAIKATSAGPPKQAAKTPQPAKPKETDLAQPPAPKPVLDPKKSLEAQKYIKEKKLQEAKRLQLEKEKRNQEKKKIELELRKIEDLRKAQRAAVQKRKAKTGLLDSISKELQHSTAAALPAAPPDTETVKFGEIAVSSPKFKSKLPLPELLEPGQSTPQPEIITGSRIEISHLEPGEPVQMESVTTTVVPLTVPLASVTISHEPVPKIDLVRYPSEKLLPDPAKTPADKPPSKPVPVAHSADRAGIALAELSEPKTAELSEPKTAGSDGPAVPALSQATGQALQLDAIRSTTAELPILIEKIKQDVSKEYASQISMIAASVVKVGERLEKVVQSQSRKVLPAPSARDEPAAAKLRAAVAVAPSKLLDDMVGVGSLAEFSRKRKEFERHTDAALTIQAFFKRQKKRQSLAELQSVTAADTTSKTAPQSPAPVLQVDSAVAAPATSSVIDACAKDADGDIEMGQCSSSETDSAIEPVKAAADAVPLGRDHDIQMALLKEKQKFQLYFSLPDTFVEHQPKEQKETAIPLPKMTRAQSGQKISIVDLFVKKLESIGAKPLPKALPVAETQAKPEFQQSHDKCEPTVSATAVVVGAIKETAVLSESSKQDAACDPVEMPPSATVEQSQPERPQVVPVLESGRLDPVDKVPGNLFPVESDVSSKSHVYSKSIQTDLELSDVSELSDIVSPAEHAASPVPKSQKFVEQANREPFPEKSLSSDGYSDDSFESVSVSEPRPTEKPSSSSRHSPGRGMAAALKRNLMGEDGQGRLTAESLATKFDLSLQHLLSIHDATTQITELDRNRTVAITQQESAAILQVLMEKEKTHFNELEKAKKQRQAMSQTIQTEAAEKSHVEYESSFESFTDDQPPPKVMSRRPSRQHTAAPVDKTNEIDTLLEQSVKKITAATRKPVLPAPREKPPVVAKKETVSGFDLKLKLAGLYSHADPEPADEPVFHSVASDESDVIEENISYADGSELSSVVEDIVHSDIASLFEKKPEATAEFNYDDESFYSVDSQEDVDSASAAEFIASFHQKLQQATKRLDPKLLAKREKVITETLGTLEHLKNFRELEMRLSKEETRIALMLDDLITPSAIATTEKPAKTSRVQISKELDEYREDDSETVPDRPRQPHVAKFDFDSISEQIDRLDDDLSSFQEKIIGKHVEKPPKPQPKIPEQKPETKEPLEAAKTAPEPEAAASFGEGGLLLHITVVEGLLKIHAQISELNRQLVAQKAALDAEKQSKLALEYQKALDMKLAIESELLQLNSVTATAFGLVTSIDLDKQPPAAPSSAVPSTVTAPLQSSPPEAGAEAVPVISVKPAPMEAPTATDQSRPEAGDADLKLADAVNSDLKLADAVNSDLKQAEAGDTVLKLVDPILVQTKEDVKYPEREDSIEAVTKALGTAPVEENDRKIEVQHADETTSDISEHLSGYDQVSVEAHVAVKTETPSEALYEEDFETFSETATAEKQSTEVASKEAKTRPEENGPSKELVQQLTESIFADLLGDSVQAMMVKEPLPEPAAKVPISIVIPRLADLSDASSPKIDLKKEPLFAEVFSGGLDVLFLELEKLLLSSDKYTAPPEIPAQLKNLLPQDIGDLLVDALGEALHQLFEKHRDYNRPARPFYEKRSIKPLPVSRERILSECRKTMQKWNAYSLVHGADLDQVLIETVKSEGKWYCDIQDDEVAVKNKLVGGIWNAVLDDTTQSLVGSYS
ncbi:hypothetical protein HDV03_003183 [Kappamyces sp. JEL0829]|nr:hypothetical protein HDV03_003183 [Kappamyces sp. JEL0829]